MRRDDAAVSFPRNINTGFSKRGAGAKGVYEDSRMRHQDELFPAMLREDLSNLFA
jgi:hypothetical protein